MEEYRDEMVTGIVWGFKFLSGKPVILFMRKCHKNFSMQRGSRIKGLLGLGTCQRLFINRGVEGCASGTSAILYGFLIPSP